MTFFIELIIISIVVSLGIGTMIGLLALLKLQRIMKLINLTKQNTMHHKTTHHLKCWPNSFQAMKIGPKTFEYRKNDRDYQVGDILHQKEWNEITSEYTGDELYQKVTYIIHGGQFGIPESYCIMAVRPL